MTKSSENLAPKKKRIVRKKRSRAPSGDSSKGAGSAGQIGGSASEASLQQPRQQRRPFAPIKIANEYLAEADSSTNFITSIESEIEALRAKRLIVIGEAEDDQQFEFKEAFEEAPFSLAESEIKAVQPEQSPFLDLKPDWLEIAAIEKS